MRFSLPLLLVLAFCLNVAWQSASAAQADIQEFVEEEADAAGVPGVSYALIEGNKTTFGHHGVTAKSDGKPVSRSTAFIIGSVSKSFTAVAIMQLKDQDQLQLSDFVSNHLPEFEDTLAGAITIRQLLSHTSGFSTLQGNSNQTDLTIDHDALERRVTALTYMIPAYEPGEQWAYSNVNYQILSRIVEVVTGLEFGAYVESEIMQPLEMKDSRMIDWQVADNDAIGHRPWFWTKMQYDGRGAGRGSLGQGGVMSSARDMAKYLLMMMNGEDDIITARSKLEMMRPASEASPGYGLGWFLDSERGLVFHSGANPGYEALATMNPQEKKAFVILTNGGSGFGFGETGYMRRGAAMIALDGPDEPRPGTAMKITYIILCILPLLFLLAAWRTWRKRNRITKRGKTVNFLLVWGPLIFATGLSYALLILAPGSFGGNIQTATLFQPNIGILLVTTAVASLIWAILCGVTARKTSI